MRQKPILTGVGLMAAFAKCVIHFVQWGQPQGQPNKIEQWGSL